MAIDMRIPTADELNAMTEGQYKVLENRLRRAADRQGLRLMKSRTRDPRSYQYGTYMLVDVATNGVVAGGWPHAYGLDLADVAQYLWGDDDA